MSLSVVRGCLLGLAEAVYAITERMAEGSKIVENSDTAEHVEFAGYMELINAITDNILSLMDQVNNKIEGINK